MYVVREVRKEDRRGVRRMNSTGDASPWTVCNRFHPAAELIKTRVRSPLMSPRPTLWYSFTRVANCNSVVVRGGGGLGAAGQTECHIFDETLDN